VIKLFWKGAYGLFSMFYQKSDLTLINVGYADLKKDDGIFLKNNILRKSFDRNRLQLYHHCVIDNGELEDMRGKTILETGCGRGGGLNYIV
jgi:hypothetical protein